MWLHCSGSTLSALSSLFILVSSLPLRPQDSVLSEPLAKRATYSVVPVDGSSADGTAGDPTPVTIFVETTTQTSPPTTTTTTVIDTITSIAYSVINVDSATTVTVVIPEPAPSLSTVQASSASSTTPTPVPTFSNSTINATSISSTTASNISSGRSSPPSHTSTFSGYLNTTGTPTPYTSPTWNSGGSLSTPTASITNFLGWKPTGLTAAPSSTSTTTFDDGKWHTHYPWLNSTLSRTAIAPTALAT